MSKCISSHGEYSEHAPGDPCPWCGECDTERIIAERDEALARIKAVEDVLAEPDAVIGTRTHVTTTRVRRALDGARTHVSTAPIHTTDRTAQQIADEED